MIPLNYPAAKDYCLFRNEEGIIFRGEGKCKFFALHNYPAEVCFSGRAIKKLTVEKPSSLIDVYANFKSGKKCGLFGMGRNFFAKVLQDKNTEKASITYTVPTFKYDPEEKIFEVEDNSERVLSEIKREAPDENDIVVSFGAEYALGYIFQDEIHQFAIKFFKSFPEKILLNMDVNEKDEWELTICQKGSS